MDWSSELAEILRVALGMALGALVGADREFARKPAGLRTHMLVAGAAALFTEVGMAMLRQYGGGSNLSTRVDPIVILQAVAAAVGFIGAGTILRHDADHVEGLTTAASLLLTAAVGVAVSSGHVVLAVGVTLLALATLRGMRWIEGWIRRRGPGARGSGVS